MVGPKDLSRLPEASEVRSFRTRAAWFATAYWMLLIPKALMPFIGVIAFQLLSLYPWDHQEVVTEKRMYPEHVDVLPTELLDELKWIPLIAFGVSMLNTVQGSVGRCHFGLLEFLPSSNGRAWHALLRIELLE